MAAAPFLLLVFGDTKLAGRGVLSICVQRINARRRHTAASRGTTRRSLTRGVPFYESDCQGRFFSLLIAFWFSPLQSAPSDLKEMNESA